MKRCISDEELLALPTDKYEEFKEWCIVNKYYVPTYVDATCLMHWLRDNCASNIYIQMMTFGSDAKWHAPFECRIGVSLNQYHLYTDGPTILDTLWKAVLKVMGVE